MQSAYTHHKSACAASQHKDADRAGELARAVGQTKKRARKTENNMQEDGGGGARMSTATTTTCLIWLYPHERVDKAAEQPAVRVPDSTIKPTGEYSGDHRAR